MPSAPITTIGTNSMILNFWGGIGSSSIFALASTVSNILNTLNTWDATQTIGSSSSAAVLQIYNSMNLGWSSSGDNQYELNVYNGGGDHGIHFQLIDPAGSHAFFFTDTDASNMLSLGVANGSSHQVQSYNNTLDDGSGNLATAGSVSPGNNATAGTASHLFSGTGTPQGNLSGTSGDYYFRVDGGVNTHLYICTGTTNWTGIL